MDIKLKRITAFGKVLILAAGLIVSLGACSSSVSPTPLSSTPSTTASIIPTTTSTTTQPASRNGSNPRQGGGSSGIITAVAGNIFTIDTAQGMVLVNVADNTSIQKNIAGSLADLKTGQFLTVSGTADASGNIAAATVVVRSQDINSRFSPSGAPPYSGNRTGGPGTRPDFGASGNNTFGGPGNGAFGTLSSIDGNTLKVTTIQGQEKTVTVGPDTVIQVMESDTLADLKVGVTVSVIGNKDASGTLDAVLISLGTRPAFTGGG